MKKARRWLGLATLALLLAVAGGCLDDVLSPGDDSDSDGSTATLGGG